MNDPAKAAAQQQPMVEMIRTEERESVLWPRIQALACDERVKSMTFAEATAYAIEHANCIKAADCSINIAHGTPGSHEHYSKYYDLL